jgi:hypothetical protein
MAWVFSRDADNIVAEQRDSAFLVLFGSILFTLSLVLFLEKFSVRVHHSYNDFADLFSLYVAKSIDTVGTLFTVFRSWMAVARWNFYTTAVGLFLAHMIERHGDEVRGVVRDAAAVDLPEVPEHIHSKFQSFMAPTLDLRYVRKSSKLDPYADRPVVNTIGVLAQILGFYATEDGTYVSVFTSRAPITDTNLVQQDRVSLLSTESYAGKLTRLFESEFRGDDTLRMVLRGVGLYATGILAADTIYRYTIENAFVYMPVRTRRHNPFKVF